MMTTSNKKLLKAGVAGAALAFGLLTAMPMLPEIGGLGGTTAWAQGQGQGGAGGGGRPEGRGQGGSTGGSVGSAPEGRGQGRPTTTGAPEGRGGTAGQRGPSADSDGTPHRGQPLPGTRGGRPVWAGDGAIPEVELGRLNVSRAPSRVLESRYAEVLANWSTMGVTQVTLGGVTYTVAQLYSLPAAQYAALLTAYYDQIVRIDSPLENLALLRAIYLAPSTLLPGITPASNSDLAAIAIASASDKTIPVSINTVVALNTILGLNIPADQVPYIASQAELVRQAILLGHG
jgi:hypothetical protein